MSLGDIARQLGVSRAAVHHRMIRLGIPTRSRSASRLLALRQGKFPKMLAHSVNERFFRSWSNEMAYVLGLMLTDGCVSQDRHTVTLAMNDREILEKLKVVMQTDIPVVQSKHQPKLHIFRITRSQIVRDLIGLGVTPRKSLTVEFPPIPDKHLSHFIRGVFDGDGSVVLARYKCAKQPTNNPWLRTMFNSGSLKFITVLEKKLRFLGMPPQAIFTSHAGKNPFYKIGYGGKDSKKLFDIMYRDAKNGLFLDRKYRVFQEGMLHTLKSEKFKVSDCAMEDIKQFFRYQCDNPRCISVAQLASYVGCTRQTIYRWARTDASNIKEKYRVKIEAFIRDRLGILEGG